MYSCLLHAPPLETQPTTQACALDQELNQQLFGSQASTQSTEPHQREPDFLLGEKTFYWLKPLVHETVLNPN